MTKEQAIEELIKCQDDDPEWGHVDADDVLCRLLISLGFDDVVEEYKKVLKWYA